jgi:hypothetical protein
MTLWLTKKGNFSASFDQYNHSFSETYIMMDIHTIYVPYGEEWTFL